MRSEKYILSGLAIWIEAGGGLENGLDIHQFITYMTFGCLVILFGIGKEKLYRLRDAPEEERRQKRSTSAANRCANRDLRHTL